MPEKDVFRGVIQKVDPKGRHGPYVIASVEGLGSVTFSLERSVWGEDDKPEPGEIVSLSKLRKKRAGWRAMQARYTTPSEDIGDTQPSKKQRSN